MNTAHRLAASLLVAAALTGCSGADDGAVGSVSANNTELPTMAEHYAVTIDSTIITEDGEGEASTSKMQVVGLMTVAQDGAALTTTLQPCRVVLPPAGDHQGTVDDAVVQRAAAAEAKALLTIGDDGARFETEAFNLQLGVEGLGLDDALPQDADDPRVVDIDEDGDPGFSIHFSLARVYSALHATPTLFGRASGGGHFEGEVEIDVEHAIYGDSNWLVNIKKLAEEAAAETTLLSETHRFTMAPLGAGATCADALD